MGVEVPVGHPTTLSTGRATPLAGRYPPGMARPPRRHLSHRPALVAAVVVVAAGACATTGAVEVMPEAPVSTTSIAPTTTIASTTSVATTTTTATTTSAATTTTTAGRSPGPEYHVQDHVAFAVAEGVELVHPAAAVELIGFHEAGHDGARQQQVLATAAPNITLETRGRGTGSRTAADIVVAPDTEIRSPVTGTVVRGGTYVLYCDYSDDFVVIEPDARPGWEVKMFHFDGLRVAATHGSPWRYDTNAAR